MRARLQGFWTCTEFFPLWNGPRGNTLASHIYTTENAWKSHLRTLNYRDKGFARCAHGSGNFGGVFAQRAHSANYYGDYPGNNPENHPPAESCTINSKLTNSNI